MNILDIAIAKKLAGGGGGSGTDNYNDLSNLPKINDTTLSGNKTSANLGLQSEINSDSKLASDLVDDTNQDNKFVTSTEKGTWNAKQNAIDADHKINADYVDDSTSTNKFVTATDKKTWSAKQNAIDNSHKLSSDLVDDANHTNKFVTSTEKNTWNGKQNAIDSEHKLSSSLVSFTTAEAAAIASGIDSSKVGQISTNQTNILYAIKTGVKNIIVLPDGVYRPSSKTTFTVVDGAVTCETTASYTDAIYISAFVIPAGTYSLTGIENNTGFQVRLYNNGTRIEGNPITLDVDTTISVALYSLGSNSSGTLTPMICLKSIYDQDSSYAKPALPNYDLTRLESEDRASLAEEIDAGAKNKWDFANCGSGNWHATTSKTDTSFTITSTDIRAYFSMWQSLPAGHYVFSAKISNLSGPDYKGIAIRANDTGGADLGSAITFNANGTISGEFTCTATTTVYFVCYAAMDKFTSTTTYTASDIMVCTKAAFGVSNKFVPFGNDPFYQVPINHNMIYRGRNLGASLTDAQHTALSSGNFTDLYLGDYWTKTVTIPAGTYTGGDGEEVTVPAQTNITLKAVIADFDTFYAGYASTYAGINTHHAAVIVTGFSNVVWNKTNSTAGGYVASLIHKWLVGSALPQIETWFGSAKVLSHQKLLTNAITGDAASGWAWSSQKISLLSENQMYGSKVWGNSKAANGGYEPGEAFKHLNVFNHIDANLLFGNKNIWLRDIASAVGAAYLDDVGGADIFDASSTGIAPAALILLS